MTLPFTPVLSAFLDYESDLSDWSASSYTHERPPQINEDLLRCPCCGCDCGVMRPASETGGSTLVDSDWEMVESSSLLSDDGTDCDNAHSHDILSHNNFPIPLPCFSQDYSCVARGTSDLTDSTEALITASSVCTTFTSSTPSPTESLMITADRTMADSDSARSLADSGVLRFTTGAALLEDTHCIRAAPLMMDD